MTFSFFIRSGDIDRERNITVFLKDVKQYRSNFFNYWSCIGKSMICNHFVGKGCLVKMRQTCLVELLRWLLYPTRVGSDAPVFGLGNRTS